MQLDVQAGVERKVHGIDGDVGSGDQLPGGLDRAVGALQNRAIGRAAGGQAQPPVAQVGVLGSQPLEPDARLALVGHLAAAEYLYAQGGAAAGEQLQRVAVDHRCSRTPATSAVTFVDTWANPSSDIASSSSLSLSSG